jgi:flavin-dependent dehydrogenase
LLRLAAVSGAGVKEGCAVAQVRSTADATAVEVTLDDGRCIRARYLVAADGMWSPVRKKLGVGHRGYLGEWVAGRQYFGQVGPEARKLWVWFEPDMAPGYAWSFPLPGGTANVGYGVIRGSSPAAGRFRGQPVDLLARPHIARVLGAEARPIGPWKAWPIPAGISATVLHALQGRVLFVGDAAHACDPMTGEGIAQALETAQMAAWAIVGAGPDHPRLAATRYERQVRWGLALDDRLARALSRVLAHPGGANRAMEIADSSGWFRHHFARWMFEDYPRAVMVTPHRWHRHLLGQPGAFAASS